MAESTDQTAQSANDELHAIVEMRTKIESLFTSNDFDAVWPLIDPFLDRYLKKAKHELDAGFCMMLSMVGNGLSRMGHFAEARLYLERAADLFECRDENLWHVVTQWEDLGDGCIKHDDSPAAHRMAEQVQYNTSLAVQLFWLNLCFQTQIQLTRYVMACFSPFGLQFKPIPSV